MSLDRSVVLVVRGCLEGEEQKFKAEILAEFRYLRKSILGLFYHSNIDRPALPLRYCYTLADIRVSIQIIVRKCTIKQSITISCLSSRANQLAPAPDGCDCHDSIVESSRGYSSSINSPDLRGAVKYIGSSLPPSSLTQGRDLVLAQGQQSSRFTSIPLIFSDCKKLVPGTQGSAKRIRI